MYCGNFLAAPKVPIQYFANNLSRRFLGGAFSWDHRSAFVTAKTFPPYDPSLPALFGVIKGHLANPGTATWEGKYAGDVSRKMRQFQPLSLSSSRKPSTGWEKYIRTRVGASLYSTRVRGQETTSWYCTRTSIARDRVYSFLVPVHRRNMTLARVSTSISSCLRWL